LSTSYFPSQGEQFLRWTQNITAYVQAEAKRMKADTSALRPIQSLCKKYQAAIAKASAPNHGSIDIQERNTIRKALETAIRDFLKANLLHNPEVSDEDRLTMGIPIYSKKPAPAPVPASFPVVEIDTSHTRQLTLRLRNAETGKRAKPKGALGAELRWHVGDAPPESVENFSRSMMVTHGSHTFSFDHEQRGKPLYFCLRWQNTRGQNGPWTEIISAVVA
jgi:hypothetical protein